MNEKIAALEAGLEANEKLALELVNELKSGTAIALRGRIHASREMLDAVKLEVTSASATEPKAKTK